MRHITPCLWFDRNAEEAVNFYVSVFKDARIKQITHYTKSSASPAHPEGSVLTVMFEIKGQEFMALNGGPQFKFNEAISLMVMCDTQNEIDTYWNALCGPGSGGQEVQCGWLKDKFGVSWQIAPAEFSKWLSSDDPQRADRFMQAMMPMKKLDIATLKKAYESA